MIERGTSSKKLGVLPLRDHFLLQEIKKLPPFNRQILHLEQEQFIVAPLLVKKMNAMGGIALVTTNSIYDLPDKLSLYIEAGIPILAKEGTAVSDIITQYKIGWCYGTDINGSETIMNITEDQYEECSKNELKLAGRLRSGDFIRHMLIDTLQNIQFHDQPITSFGSLYRPAKYNLMVMNSNE
ncbi:hypothetical protein [Limosilactobacillus walteri]|uniref:hypothetical protein n=1 Tax=Limosilactobacillus walteri TaxID=2268022 RepID=UPI001CD88A8E|nr:hypothetical protein [Limosilactobacillus walteri]